MGITIKRENLPEFRRRLNEYARECLSEGQTESTLDAECELSPEDITLEQASELYGLEPFGVSNPVPMFVLYDVPLYSSALVGGGKHARLTLKVGGSLVNAMCFRRTLSELDIYPGDPVDVLFSLDINEFRDQKNVQLIVKDVRLARKRADEEIAEHELYKAISERGNADGIDAISLRAVIPTREDCAAVYSLLRRELRVEHEVFSMRALLNLLASGGSTIGYVKLRFILSILDELNLIGVKLTDEEYEIYTFRYIAQDGKTSLDNSALFCKLKALIGN